MESKRVRADDRQAATALPTTLDGSTPEHRCGNCRFWGKGDGQTVCRKRLPPSTFAMSPMGTASVLRLFTPMLENDWCGEWEAGQNGLKPN